MKKLIFMIFLLIAAVNLYSQKVEVSPVDFNSKYDDFNSALSNNGNVIYFTSGREGGEQKIFMVEKTSTGWSEPKELNSELNDGKQNGASTLTTDGQFMIFSSFDHGVGSQGRTDLYSAEKKNGKWTNIKNLGKNINSEAWDSQPSLSNDGNTLYFVSDRDGGMGGTDIYVSKKVKGGWSDPVSAGSKINTSSDEMSPVLSPDNKTMTFSSNRPGGVGGFDIYASSIIGGSFGTPKHLDEPINSANDEHYYYIVPNSEVAFFTTDRSGGSGGFDIYSAVPNPVPSDDVFLLSGKVKDIITKENLGADITVSDLKTGKKVAELRSDDETGDYFVTLQRGKVYSITASKKGYVFYSDQYALEAKSKDNQKTKDIYLSPVSNGNTRLLVFFDFDKATLKDESIPELERMVEFLKDNPDINILIEGHTDDVGSDDYNDKLSSSRAKAVKEQMVKDGIDANRIQTKGIGKRKPLIDEKTDDARAQNRRVEMKIVKS